MMLKKHVRVVLATASIVLLSSCALPTSVLPQSASSDPQPSGTTQSQGSDGGDSGTDAKTTDAGKQDSFANRTVGEALEIGKFSPEQHSQPAFNPCREVTEEQWKSLGLRVNRADDGTTGLSTICTLKVIPEQTEPAQSTIITGNFNPLSKELEKGERLNDVKIKKPSYVYLYSSTKPYRDICSAGTMTNQGRVAVSYGEFSNKVAPPSAEKTCQKAVDVLEGIFNLPVLTPTTASAAPASQATPTSQSTPTPTTSATSPSVAGTKPTKPADSVSAGETFRQKLGVGKFDNDEAVHKTFNPCKEITKNQWESLKLKVKSGEQPTLKLGPDQGDAYECFLASTDEGEHAGEAVKIAVDYLDFLSSDIGKNIVNIKANKPDYVYFYDKNSDLAEDECTAGVVTNRGRLNLTLRLGEKAAKPTKEQACQQAADRLMAISNLKAEGLDNVLHK